MGRVMGVDPGLGRTGVALIDAGRFLEAWSVRGALTGPGIDARRRSGTVASRFTVGQDFGLGVRVADALARDVLDLAVRRGAELVAVESYVHQGPSRRGPHAWQGAVAAAAFASHAARCGIPVVYQDAADVLGPRGYGLIKQQAKHPTQAAKREWGFTHALDDHEASAFCHALWAEAAVRRAHPPAHLEPLA